MDEKNGRYIEKDPDGTEVVRYKTDKKYTMVDFLVSAAFRKITGGD